MIHTQDPYSLAAQEDRCSPRTKLSIPAQLRASGGRPVRTVVHDLYGVEIGVMEMTPLVVWHPKRLFPLRDP